MITMTTIIRVKAGHEGVLEQALVETARRPETEAAVVSVSVSRDAGEPTLFTSHLRAKDRATLDRYLTSPVVTDLFDRIQPLLEGDVLVKIGEEIHAAP